MISKEQAKDKIQDDSYGSFFVSKTNKKVNFNIFLEFVYESDLGYITQKIKEKHYYCSDKEKTYERGVKLPNRLIRIK